MHEILLLRDMLHPFPLAHVRTRPERDLVVLAAQVHECDREAAFGVLDGHDGRMRRVLDQLLLSGIHRLLVLQRVVVWGGDEQKLQWDRLRERPVSRGLVP